MVLAAVPWPLMVWSTLALGTYQLRFVSWVFHVIFSFVYFISLYTLGGLRAFRKPLPYNMYLFNLRIANHILIKIIIKIKFWNGHFSLVHWTVQCTMWTITFDICLLGIYLIIILLSIKRFTNMISPFHFKRLIGIHE